MDDQREPRPPQHVAEAVSHYVARTIPVHVEIDARQAVLNLSEAEEVLRGASAVALGPCRCRQKSGGCDAPVDVCLTLNETSVEAVAKREGFRYVSVGEALTTLRASHEAGLVHLAYRKQGGELVAFCSCCTCCCFFLSALRQFDYHDAIAEASHAAAHDPARCIGCETCLGRCPFGAWSAGPSGGKPSLSTERCFGCGLCVSTCPAGAIAFVPRTAPPTGQGLRSAG